MTAKLVKARYKSDEYLPEWARCCKRFTAECSSKKELLLDLNQRGELIDSCCTYCKTPHGRIVGFLDMKDGKYEAIELLDLDEGQA
jgi:hypothetical protein